jgi:hypothetical protein
MSPQTPGPWLYDHDTGTIDTDRGRVVAYNRYQRTDEETESAAETLKIIEAAIAKAERGT